MKNGQRIDVDVTAQSAAAPAEVFAVLHDGAGWPAWSSFTGYELVQRGVDGDPNGVGAVRIFKTQVTASCEEIVELIPNRRLSYILRSGLPMANYRADVDVEAKPDGGTTVRWHSTFDPKVRGTGWFWRMFMKAVLSKLVTQLVAEAERRVKTSSL